MTRRTHDVRMGRAETRRVECTGADCPECARLREGDDRSRPTQPSQPTNLHPLMEVTDADMSEHARTLVNNLLGLPTMDIKGQTFVPRRSDRRVLLGPVMWDLAGPQTNEIEPGWWIVLCADAHPQDENNDHVTAGFEFPDKETADIGRAALYAELLERTDTVLTFADDLDMARTAYEFWPGPHTHFIRTKLERQRERLH